MIEDWVWVCVCVHWNVSMADLCLAPQVIDHRQAFIQNGPISVCLSAGDWDHKETYMDQTQKGPLHTTPSILTPEKLLFFLPQGRDLLAPQLETAQAIDGLYNRNQQQSFFTLSVFFIVTHSLLSVHLMNVDSNDDWQYIKCVGSGDLGFAEKVSLLLNIFIPEYSSFMLDSSKGCHMEHLSCINHCFSMNQNLPNRLAHCVKCR